MCERIVILSPTLCQLISANRTYEDKDISTKSLDKQQLQPLAFC